MTQKKDGEELYGLSRCYIQNLREYRTFEERKRKRLAREEKAMRGKKLFGEVAGAWVEPEEAKMIGRRGFVQIYKQASLVGKGVWSRGGPQLEGGHTLKVERLLGQGLSKVAIRQSG